MAGSGLAIDAKDGLKLVDWLKYVFMRKAQGYLYISWLAKCGSPFQTEKPHVVGGLGVVPSQRIYS